MGANAEDTQRQIGALRADMSAALDELQGRLRGGIGGVLGSDARVSGSRGGQTATARVGEALGQVRENPAALSAAGAVAVGTLGYAVYTALDRWRESRKPQNRLRRRIKGLREEVESRVGDQRKRVQGRVQDTHKRVQETRKRGVLLKVEREGDEYLRVKEAKLDIPKDEKGSRRSVLKNLLWAALLAVFMASASVLARRAAGAVWQATLREAPPTEQK